MMGFPDAAYKNNADGSWQRGQCIFICQPRNKERDTRGSLIDYESHKIKSTVLSTTVAELYAFMKCYGSAQFYRGLWMDMTAQPLEVHLRTDANNLVTTAASTRLPEQKETIHMIQMLRQEACSGQMYDLAHVLTQYCLADPLTKKSVSPTLLISTVQTGILREVDTHPLIKPRGPDAPAVPIKRVGEITRRRLCFVPVQFRERRLLRWLLSQRLISQL